MFFRACLLSIFIATNLVSSAFADETLTFPQATGATQNAQVCAYTALLHQTVSEASEDEIKAALQIAGIEITASSAKEQLQLAFDSFCIQSESLGSGVVRAGKLTASMITSLLTAPIRFVAKFGIGIWTHRRTQERGSSYSQTFGSAKTTPVEIALTGYQAYRVFLLSSNPWLFAASIVTSIDSRAGELCRDGFAKNEKSANFCRTYEALKKGEYEFTENGKSAGVWIGKKLLHTFDFRSDDELNPKICEASLEKQMRIARHSRERLADRIEKLGVTDVQVEILSPEVNGCVTIIAQFANQEALDHYSKKLPGIIDGIAYSLQAKKAESKKDLDLVDDNKVTPTTDYSAAGVCKYLYDLKGFKLGMKDRTPNSFFELMKLVNNPHKIAELNWKEVPVNADKWAGPQASRRPGKNYILILSPSAQQLDEFKAAQTQYKNIREQYLVEQNKLKDLWKVADDYNSCLQKHDEIRYQAEKMVEFKKQLDGFATVHQIEEFEAMRKLAKQANRNLFSAHHLKLNWEIHEFSDFNEFHDLLRDPSIENVLVITHGASFGKIIDPYYNIFPHAGFADVSPALKSISFFSCSAEQSVHAYGLEKLFQTQASHLPVRYVGFSEAMGAAKDNSENFAALITIPQFIEDLDQEVYRSQIRDQKASAILGAIPSKKPAELSAPLCSAQFSGAAIHQGAMTLWLNYHWLGIFYSDHTATNYNYSFPCSWLNESGKNNAGLQNATATSNVGKITSDDLRLQIKSADGKDLFHVDTNKSETVPANTHEEVTAVSWEF